MKKAEKGFGIIALVMLASALVVLGFITWKVYVSINKPSSDAVTTVNPILYTDTANRFSFYYPANWNIDWPENGDIDGSPAKPQAVKTESSRPIVIKPVSGQKGNNIAVVPGCSAANITETKARKDQFHTQEDLTINGYTAFYDKLDFKDSAERYLHHTYIVLSQNDCLEIAFRENHHHDMSNTNFDDGGNMSEFNAIVRSVKFIN